LQALPFHARKFVAKGWCSPRFLWLLGGIAFVLACSAGVRLAFPLAGLLAALLLAATLFDALTLPACPPGVRRELPGHFCLGRIAEVRYQLESTSDHAMTVAFEEAPMRTMTQSKREHSVKLRARGRCVVTTEVTPAARGSDAFTCIYLRYESSGLGLVRRRSVIEALQPIRVLPDLSALKRYGRLHVRNRFIEAGLRRLRLRGNGSEFESVREYADGDGFRSIDWKATARRGKVMVVQREIERAQDVMLMLDCGRLMTARLDRLRKLDHAIAAALSLASIASLASDRVGAIAFAATVLAARAPRPTTSSARALVEALYGVEARFEESDYARALSYVRTHLQRRSLVVLFTDVIDPIAQSAVLAELGSLARRHVVLCVLMNDSALSEILSRVPQDAPAAYRVGVALELEQERKTAARALRRSGVMVLDVPAARLSASAIEEYLRIKSRAVL
jgi:uncharacterized protein (DUF58 family)